VDDAAGEPTTSDQEQEQEPAAVAEAGTETGSDIKAES
jgi:hypothetical protein